MGCIITHQCVESETTILYSSLRLNLTASLGMDGYQLSHVNICAITYPYHDLDAGSDDVCQ